MCKAHSTHSSIAFSEAHKTHKLIVMPIFMGIMTFYAKEISSETASENVKI